MSTYVLGDYLFGFLKPAYVVWFEGDVAGLAGDLVCGGQIDSWLVIFEDNCWRCLGEA